MRIYYNTESITDNCKNECPFVLTKEGRTPMVGSCYCKKSCMYCYGHSDTIGFVGYPDSEDKIKFHYPSYVKCYCGYNHKTKYKLIRFVKKLIRLI